MLSGWRKLHYGFSPQLNLQKICPLTTLFSTLIPTMAASDDEEDDYMSMVIEEPTQKESFTQRKRREQREVPSHIHIPALRPWQSRNH